MVPLPNSQHQFWFLAELFLLHLQISLLLLQDPLYHGIGILETAAHLRVHRRHLTLIRSREFLQHLTSVGLKIGDTIKVEEINEFDASFKVKINKENIRFFSNKVAASILVEVKK